MVEVGRRLKCERPVVGARKEDAGRDGEAKKLFRLSGESGELRFELVKEGVVGRGDLDGNDVFVLDDGRSVWVWEGQGASRAEKAMWLRVAQRYIAQNEDRAGLSVSKVVQGNESRGFWAAVEA